VLDRTASARPDSSPTGRGEFGRGSVSHRCRRIPSLSGPRGRASKYGLYSRPQGRTFAVFPLLPCALSVGCASCRRAAAGFGLGLHCTKRAADPIAPVDVLEDGCASTQPSLSRLWQTFSGRPDRGRGRTGRPTAKIHCPGVHRVEDERWEYGRRAPRGAANPRFRSPSVRDHRPRAAPHGRRGSRVPRSFRYRGQ
jgi:hypothetical protein